MGGGNGIVERRKEEIREEEMKWVMEIKEEGGFKEEEVEG